MKVLEMETKERDCRGVYRDGLAEFEELV